MNEQATSQKFEAGRNYYMTSVCDHNCRWEYNVTRRTAKSVWLVQVGSAKAPRRFGIKTFMGEELVYPLGSYSMSPILGAEKVF